MLFPRKQLHRDQNGMRGVKHQWTKYPSWVLSQENCFDDCKLMFTG